MSKRSKKNGYVNGIADGSAYQEANEPERIRGLMETHSTSIADEIHKKMDESGLTLDQALYILKVAKDKVRQYTPKQAV